MSTTKQAASARVKAERAHKYLDELEIEVAAFLQSNPCKITTRLDPKTQELAYYAASVTEFPPSKVAVAADLLQNLRSALDYLVYELVVNAGHSPTRNTGFPIFGSLAIYKAQASEKVRGVCQEAIDVIDSLKPYKDGNNDLWCLSALNNVGKHRLLRTVALVHRFDTVTPAVLKYVRKSWDQQPYASEPFPDSPTAKSFVEFQLRPVLVKTGDVVFSETPESPQMKI